MEQNVSKMYYTVGLNPISPALVLKVMFELVMVSFPLRKTRTIYFSPGVRLISSIKGLSVANVIVLLPKKQKPHINGSYEKTRNYHTGKFHQRHFGLQQRHMSLMIISSELERCFMELIAMVLVLSIQSSRISVQKLCHQFLLPDCITMNF